MSLDHTNSLLNLKQIHCLICYEKISFLWRRFLQGKQTCFFANLRVVGYSEAQRDIWQNLSMDESERAVFMKFLCFLCTVKLANSASPFKFRQVKFPQQVEVLRIIKCVFTNSVNCIEFLLAKNTFYHPQDQFFKVFCGNLTWQNLKRLAARPFSVSKTRDI